MFPNNIQYIMPVNLILRDEITKITKTLIPPGFQGTARDVRDVQNNVARIINSLGEESAKSQNLDRVLTTSEKLQNKLKTTVYLLKDPAANGNSGEVIGLLKVGQKNLYLFDSTNTICEVEPLCVLDFYVRSEYQRRGYGKRLFDHMLRTEGVEPDQLAVDGPSHKMLMFLKKNYGLEHMTKQSNNFAISDVFFTSNKWRSSEQDSPSPSRAVGRHTAPKPPSEVAQVIHGTGGGLNPHYQSNSSFARLGFGDGGDWH